MSYESLCDKDKLEVLQAQFYTIAENVCRLAHNVKKHKEDPSNSDIDIKTTEEELKNYEF
jgi:hypothetical protein